MKEELENTRKKHQNQLVDINSKHAISNDKQNMVKSRLSADRSDKSSEEMKSVNSKMKNRQKIRNQGFRDPKCGSVDSVNTSIDRNPNKYPKTMNSNYFYEKFILNKTRPLLNESREVQQEELRKINLANFGSIDIAALDARVLAPLTTTNHQTISRKHEEDKISRKSIIKKSKIAYRSTYEGSENVTLTEGATRCKTRGTDRRKMNESSYIFESEGNNRVDKLFDDTNLSTINRLNISQDSNDSYNIPINDLRAMNDLRAISVHDERSHKTAITKHEREEFNILNYHGKDEPGYGIPDSNLKIPRRGSVIEFSYLDGSHRDIP